MTPVVSATFCCVRVEESGWLDTFDASRRPGFFPSAIVRELGIVIFLERVSIHS